MATDSLFKKKLWPGVKALFKKKNLNPLQKNGFFLGWVPNLKQNPFFSNPDEYSYCQTVTAKDAAAANDGH